MYGNEVILLGKTCLIIVDMQLGFINEHTKHLPEKIADFINNHSSFDFIAATRYCIPLQLPATN